MLDTPLYFHDSLDQCPMLINTNKFAILISNLIDKDRHLVLLIGISVELHNFNWYLLLELNTSILLEIA